jgi:NAD(P) transhydrogenase
VDDYDLIVIGSGPAGEKGAAQAAYFGKRVAVIEREPYPGGAGTNTGTVPSKTLRETARYYSGLTQHALYGLDFHVKNELTVKDLMYREQEVVRSLRQVIAENIARHAIDYVQGHASFADPHTIRASTTATRSSSWSGCRARWPWSAPGSSAASTRRSSPPSASRSA